MLDITSTPIPAPVVTPAILRQVLATPQGVVVQLPDGYVEALPEGLTKAQANNPDIVVILDHQRADAYLAVAPGSNMAERRAAAAEVATTVLGWQHERGLL